MGAATLAIAAVGTASAHGAGDAADLSVSATSVKGGTAFVGTRLAEKAQVVNRGKTTAPASALGFYLSSNASWSSADTPLGTAKVRSLRPGAKISIAKRVKVPAGAPRLEPLRVLVCADDALKLAERKETNNCKLAAAKVVVADRTAFDAIGADRLQKRISSEKALMYELFAGFDDKRLPKRYDFADGAGGDLTAVSDEALARFDSLSSKTQEAVAPLLMPPAYRADTPPARRSATLDSCGVMSPAWNPVSADVGAVIWWKSSRPEDEARANALAGELSSTIWPTLTTLMHTEPISDAGHNCAGIDGRLDIYLDPIDVPVTSQFNSSCGPSASDIILPADAPRATLAHEFMHVLQKTYTRLAPCNQLAYLNDATATWAEDYVYPADNTEHHFDELLRYPDLRFNEPPTAGYPAWALFFSAVRHGNTAAVPAFHAAAATQPPLDALDTALKLADSWPQLARDGWNRALGTALTESFFSWDALSSVPDTKPRTYSLQGKRTTYPLPIELWGIGRQYQDIDLSDKKAKLVTFLDPAPTEVDPNLRTYAYYRLADGTWKGADWTGQPEVEFCRETEDVREVILVHSTTTRPRGPGGATPVAKTDKARLRLADKCDPSALFDATSVSATFDATLNGQDLNDSCTSTRDIHWTASLAPNSEPAELSVYYRDDHNRPVLTFTTPPRGIPLNASATGAASETCSDPAPGSNGTVRCNVSVQDPESVSIGTNEDTNASQMGLDWVWGFSSIKYDPSDGAGGNGGVCAYSGPRPPSIGDFAYSPGLFVSPLNDGDVAAEPVGTTRIAASAFGENSVTLTFSGSDSTAFTDDREASHADFSWSMTAVFTRR